jgi:hypothetical protein
VRHVQSQGLSYGLRPATALPWCAPEAAALLPQVAHLGNCGDVYTRCLTQSAYKGLPNHAYKGPRNILVLLSNYFKQEANSQALYSYHARDNGSALYPCDPPGRQAPAVFKT